MYGKYIPYWPLHRLNDFSSWRKQCSRKVLRGEITNGGINWLCVSQFSKRKRRKERGRLRELK